MCQRLTTLFYLLSLPLFEQAPGLTATGNLPRLSAQQQPGQSPTTYAGRQIRVGSGGGFTGTSTTYYLLDNGLLFSQHSRDTTYTPLGKLTTAHTKRLFRAVETTCHIRTARFSKPGNLYHFLGWQQGRETHKVTWGATDTTVLADYTKTYALFMNLLPTAARSR